MAYHDEYERALNAGRKKLSRTAKIALGLAAVLLIGAGALGAMAWIAVRTVSERIEDFRESPATMVAERLIEADPDLEWVSSEPDAGRVTFRNVQTSELHTVEAEDFLEGRLRVLTEEGELTLDLHAGDDGGSLVIRTDGEEAVRFDAHGDEDGGSLTITTTDGEVFRLDAEGDDDGGHLTVRTEDGEAMRLDATRDGEGGSFTMRLDGEEVARLDVDDLDDAGRFTLHTSAGSMDLTGLRSGGEVPAWVPEFDGAVKNQRVYTADADEGVAGAVRFETSVPVERVVERYEDALERRGEVKSHNWQIMGSRIQASLMGESRDGRIVMVIAAGGEEKTTHVVVTWADPD